MRYRVRLNGQNVYSAESVITVTPAGVITPAIQTVSSGGSVALSHTGASGVTSRQWELSTNNGSTWAPISGATGTSYDTGALTNTGTSNITMRYRVKINGQNVYSAESVITVSPPSQPSITGSSTLCTLDSYEYQLQGTTADSWELVQSTYYYELYPDKPFTVSSYGSTSAWVKIESAFPHDELVTAVLQAKKQGVVVASKTIEICYSGIELSSNGSAVNPTAYFYLQSNAGNPSINTNGWDKKTISGTINLINPETTRVSVYADDGAKGTLFAVSPGNFIASAVVIGNWSKGGGGIPSYITVYPNPVSDVLIVEIDESEAAQYLDLQNHRSQSVLTFDVRLYDGQGNLLSKASTKGGTVEFNVSVLPDGFYYLYVYDGISEKPVMQKIVVER